MAHFGRKHFAGFLGQLALTYVEEDSEHDPADDALVFAPTARGYPPDLIAVHDAEVDLVCAQNVARCRERGPYPVEIFWVDAGGQVFEGDQPVALGHPPQAMRALVQGNLIGIDVPRPQGDPGRVRGDAQAVRVPHRRGCALP